MSYTICVDGGTTNTRIYLLDDAMNFVGCRKLQYGARDVAVIGNNTELKNNLKHNIRKLLKFADIKEEDVNGIFCSGMITSENGLAEVPHLKMPVGIDELKRGIVRAEMADVAGIPFFLIPGVKTQCDSLDKMDVMRGEETEIVGLLDRADCRNQKAVFILTGSHTKLILTDEQGRISQCMTTMAGELLGTLTFQTILKKSLPDRFLEAEDFDRSAVLEGVKIAAERSFSNAVFMTRLYERFYAKDKWKAANFLMGIICYQDCICIKKFFCDSMQGRGKIFLLGKSITNICIRSILESCFDINEVIELKNDGNVAAKGAAKIAKYYFMDD